MKIDISKAALWTFLLAAIICLIIIAFPYTPEVEAALTPPSVQETVNDIQLYDVPLDDSVQLHIIETCEEYGIDQELVLAIIGQESNYNAEAIGDGGNSVGLMQIQPKWHKSRMDRLGITDLSDPCQNVTVGIDLLAELIGKDNGTEWAITAFNAGEGTANFYKKIGERTEYTESVLQLREVLQNGK